ncbi:MAG: phosphoribosylformylglycinamidine synthase I [Candidatus Omnitrophota bacterium]
MKKVKTIILRTAGTNCDMETAHAFRLAGADADLVHINALIKKKGLFDKYHILAVPGGFTYGDDVASGKILANEIKFNLKEQLYRFVRSGKLIIGICNGFQVLVKMGLLPGIKGLGCGMEATLSLNDSGKFNAKWVYLGQGSGGREKCVWVRGLPEVLYLPIAHAEGKFIPGNGRVLSDLRKNGQIVFRYTDKEGKASGAPYNPNGSVDDIAGICDPSGRILGMMPHPERHVSYLQHPNWRRAGGRDPDMGVGLRIFENGVNFVKNNF